MLLLKNLFGLTTPKLSYRDAAVEFVDHLFKRVPLLVETSGAMTYTDIEQAAVTDAKLGFQRGILATAHRRQLVTLSDFSEAVQTQIDKLLSEVALRAVAGEVLSTQCGLASVWQQSICTNLKAWLPYSNPNILLDMARMLRTAGANDLALMAINAATLFPEFAQGKHDTDYAIAVMFVRSAFPFQRPFGDFIEEHVGANGMFSPDKLSLLKQRAAQLASLSR